MMLKINKSSFNDFLTDVMRYNELVAPVQSDESRFEVIKDVSKIQLGLHTYFPAKHFFFKPHQTLYRFEKGKVKVPEPAFDKKQRVMVGLKRCDLNSIRRQDIMFMKETADPYYTDERERTILIGYHCLHQFDEYCFCSSMDLGDYYDLMLYEKEDAYLVEIGSERGRTFVDRYRKYFWDTDLFLRPDDRRMHTDLQLNTKDIAPYHDHPDWKKKGVDICFSCAACVTLCPSCYCFDLYDKTDAKLVNSEVRRNWASCQLQCFTKVAGGHVFRSSRDDRFKHRIYHQVQYFKERHDMTLCTGCGRCIRGCPTRINWVNIINEMEEKERKE
ncbi:4Fe-4S dicluster domain-containing protein [Candidatus Woesearchaeota archaeon]|nr:4Fe-4S dicluster domain-containing protein [Candidatus Woesearchaeota archaeon]